MKTCAETTHLVLRAIEGSLAGDALQALESARLMVQQQMQMTQVRVPLENKREAA